MISPSIGGMISAASAASNSYFLSGSRRADPFLTASFEGSSKEWRDDLRDNTYERKSKKKEGKHSVEYRRELVDFDRATLPSTGQALSDHIGPMAAHGAVGLGAWSAACVGAATLFNNFSALSNTAGGLGTLAVGLGSMAASAIALYVGGSAMGHAIGVVQGIYSDLHEGIGRWVAGIRSFALRGFAATAVPTLTDGALAAGLGTASYFGWAYLFNHFEALSYTPYYWSAQALTAGAIITGISALTAGYRTLQHLVDGGSTLPHSSLYELEESTPEYRGSKKADKKRGGKKKKKNKHTHDDDD